MGESSSIADDPKHAMTARYLYEHFFLAHLSVPRDGSGRGGRVLRARAVDDTAGRADLESIVATVRPYDDPGVSTAFYYRFRKIHSTIVYKTHMVVEFDDETPGSRGIADLFIETGMARGAPRAWRSTTEARREPIRDLRADSAASPAISFCSTTPSTIIRTFIRGPVCKGQIALNVITTISG